MKPSKSILNILRHKEENDNQSTDTVQVRLFRFAGVEHSNASFQKAFEAS